MTTNSRCCAHGLMASAAVRSKQTLKLNLLLATDQQTKATRESDVILSCETRTTASIMTMTMVEGQNIFHVDDDFQLENSHSSFPHNGKFLSMNFENVNLLISSRTSKDILCFWNSEQQ